MYIVTDVSILSGELCILVVMSVYYQESCYIVATLLLMLRCSVCCFKLAEHFSCDSRGKKSLFYAGKFIDRMGESANVSLYNRHIQHVQ